MNVAGTKRTQSHIAGAARAEGLARTEGAKVGSARRRRRLCQTALAGKVGISRSRLANVEAGRGAGLPLRTWLALGDALGMYLKFEFVRDPLQEPADVGHLDIQQLIVRLAKQAGFDDRRVELPGHTARRWTDVALVKRAERLLVLTECVNTFDDIGSSFRSSDRKAAEAEQLAVVLGGDGAPFDVRLCWIVRDSARNRELLRRYEDLFASRFPGSSTGWVHALTDGGPPPAEPGLVWCDIRATRLFAWRRRAANV